MQKMGWSPEVNCVRNVRVRDTKKRFSDEQIRSLECMFQEEARLEPKRKEELARDLGLHPRQVAIWFQNRRARLKTKQLERDYSALRANYEALASDFDSLKKEKQRLLKQLQNLTDLLQKPREDRHCSSSSAQNVSDGNSEYGDTKLSEEKTNFLLEERAECTEAPYSTDHKQEHKKHVEEFHEMKEPSVLHMNAENSIQLTDWGTGFDSSCFPDQTSSSFPWWDIWH